MAVTVKLFAVYRDLLGCSELEVDLPAQCTVSGAFDQVVGGHASSQLRQITMFAINERYVPADTVVNDGDRIAFIPPVSGG